MNYTYDYPRPAITVDAVVLFRSAGISNILLVRRKNPPFDGYWSFPGGFVDENETLEEAVVRETEEETGLKGLFFNQFKAFSEPNRDPRHRTITVVFYAFVSSDISAMAGDDAAEAEWFPLDHLPDLAFDHGIILKEFLTFINE